MSDPISLDARRQRRAGAAPTAAPIVGSLLSTAQLAVADDDLHGSDLIAQATGLLEATVRTRPDGSGEDLLGGEDATARRLHSLVLTAMDQAASLDRLADAIDRAHRNDAQVIADAITAAAATTAASHDRLAAQLSRFLDALTGSGAGHDPADES